jgi:pimeloyl-ACP methyl ester carboxylesterase
MMTKRDIKWQLSLLLVVCSSCSSLPGPDSSLFTVPYGNNKKVGKYAEINGIKMYYEIYGRGEPLILIHGNDDDIQSMEYQIRYFSRYYRVIAADSRGHGKSSLGDGRLTYEKMADDWASLLDELGIDSSYVIGWSDGGIIGLLLAIHHASKVRMLAVMGANLRPDTSAVYYWAVNWVKQMDQMADSMIARNDTSQDWYLRKQILDLLGKQPHIPLADLHTISVPVLVLAGDRDVIREEHTILIYQNLKKAHLCIFPGSTHGIPVEDPELFNRTVHRFFKNPFTRPDTRDDFR